MIRTVGNIATIMVAALLCYLMQVSKPHYNDLVRTIPVKGEFGKTIQSRFLNARAEKVQFARYLRVDQNNTVQTLTTGGLWAIVTMEIEATKRPLSLYRRTWNGPAGLVFDESSRVASGLPTDFTVGLPHRGLLIFEILPDQARNASLRISRDWMTEFDNELYIDLGDVELQPDGQPTVIETLDLRQSREG